MTFLHTTVEEDRILESLRHTFTMYDEIKEMVGRLDKRIYELHSKLDEANNELISHGLNAVIANDN